METLRECVEAQRAIGEWLGQEIARRIGKTAAELVVMNISVLPGLNDLRFDFSEETTPWVADGDGYLLAGIGPVYAAFDPQTGALLNF